MITHIQENEGAPKTSKFTCKCEACSQCLSKTTNPVQVHHQTHAKSKNDEKHGIPDVIPPFSSKSRVLHMFTVSTGIYTSITHFATIPMQFSQSNSRHATQCNVYDPSHPQNHCEHPHTKCLFLCSRWNLELAPRLLFPIEDQKRVPSL